MPLCLGPVLAELVQSDIVGAAVWPYLRVGCKRFTPSVDLQHRCEFVVDDATETLAEAHSWQDLLPGCPHPVTRVVADGDEFVLVSGADDDVAALDTDVCAVYGLCCRGVAGDALYTRGPDGSRVAAHELDS